MTTAFGMAASKRSMSFSELCNRKNADINEEMSFFIYISNTRSVMVVKTELPDFHPLQCDFHITDGKEDEKECATLGRGSMFLHTKQVPH